MKYGRETHKRAYELWESGYNLSQISKVPGMPDRRTIRSWMTPAFECNCGYHGWAAIRNERIKAEKEDAPIKEITAPDDPIEAEVTCELRQEVLNRLSNMFGKNVETTLTGDMDADLVSTAYLILNRVRNSLPHINVDDPYKATQLLRVAFSMLSSVRPSIEVSQEKTDVKISMPEFKRDKTWGNDEDDEEADEG